MDTIQAHQMDTMKNSLYLKLLFRIFFGFRAEYGEVVALLWWGRRNNLAMLIGTVSGAAVTDIWQRRWSTESFQFQ